MEVTEGSFLLFVFVVYLLLWLSIYIEFMYDLFKMVGKTRTCTNVYGKNATLKR